MHLNFRDVFAPISFRKRIEAFSAYEFDIQKEDDTKAEDVEENSNHLSTTTAIFSNETNTTIETTKHSMTTQTIRNNNKKLKKRQYYRIPFAAFLYNFAIRS